jgi:hypothetical protein
MRLSACRRARRARLEALCGGATLADQIARREVGGEQENGSERVERRQASQALVLKVRRS